jgi:hypothetical protein
VRNLRGDVAVGVPVHLHPRLDRLVSGAGGAECADQVGVGHGQAVAVADPAGQLGGLRSEPRHINGYGLLGTGAGAGVLHGVVTAAVADLVARRSTLITTASSSMSGRAPTQGHGSPKMCSLSASPLPTPRTNRPPRWTAAVAAAWAMTAGWIRIVGQITAVAMCSDVTSEGAPMTSHTNGLWPCSSFQGWK